MSLSPKAGLLKLYHAEVMVEFCSLDGGCSEGVFKLPGDTNDRRWADEKEHGLAQMAVTGQSSLATFLPAWQGLWVQAASGWPPVGSKMASRDGFPWQVMTANPRCSSSFCLLRLCWVQRGD